MTSSPVPNRILTPTPIPCLLSTFVSAIWSSKFPLKWSINVCLQEFFNLQLQTLPHSSLKPVPKVQEAQHQVYYSSESTVDTFILLCLTLLSQIPDKDNAKRERLIWLTVCEYSTLWPRRQPIKSDSMCDSETMGQLFTLYLQSVRKKEMNVFTFSFSIFFSA